ncbi:LysR family transcriptional regulator [Pseudomaricurvus alkylphenolicus]|uniref:LysR family transcriptional regulator n=1 Tax=Pseudomaricurvus alkylphenolicus TaxID=1306991 RepID=UPI00141E4C0D|nr:LysR family transcriptional regulator [Pseudomaricurvus alkylphenolicus]NIB40497.1 LysR family transcriptional regulator [Pseudomaricurvus alkylphenolicus]
MVNPVKNLRALDLNLLPVLRSLIQTKSVSRTAEVLHMSQSAVSEALKRIRLQFEDEILVRAGRSMVLTHFAGTLEPRLARALSEIESMTQPQELELETLRRELVIATADNVVATLGCGLLADLSEHAPNVHVKFLDLQDLDINALKRGDLDLVILPEGFIDEPELHHLELFQEDFVAISRKGLFNANLCLTEQDLRAVQRIGFCGDTTLGLRIIGPTEPEDKEQIMIPQLTLLPYFVEQSEAVALVQRPVAERFTRYFAIDIHEIDLGLPTVKVCAYWAEVHHNDEFHHWFRDRLVDNLACDIRYCAE